MSIPYSRYILGTIPWYGVLIVTGMMAAIALATHEEKRRQLPADTVLDLGFWVLPLGVMGARLYYVCFQWQVFAQDPLSILRLWEGGLAIYGGVIGGLIAILLFARRRRMNPFVLSDMIVPGLSLAQGIGRWGNYFNMEAYGRVITDPRWQFFPNGVQIPSGSGYTWHMATFFYESCWDVAVFALLWFLLRKRCQCPGTLTLWYLLLYGTGRFIIEGMRTDSLMLGGLRVSQALSLALVLISAVLLLVNARRQKS